MTQTTLKAKPAAKAVASKKRAKADSEDEGSDNDDGFGGDSVMSSTPPDAKKAKKAPGPKKGGAKPLADVANESFGTDGTVEPSKETGAADKYQKVSLPNCIPWHVIRS